MSAVTDKSRIKATCRNGVWTRIIEDPGDAWRNFGQTLLDGMRRVPERVGQIDGLTGQEDTYSSMADRAVRCAVWLRKLGVKAGDVIGISTHNHLDTFVPVLAAIFTGAVFHPWWDINLDEDMVKYFLKLGEPKVMFVNKKAAEMVGQGIDDLAMSTKVVVFEDLPDWATLHAVLRNQTTVEVQAFECTTIADTNQPAVIICTSGSTGYPKGVVHSYCWLEKCAYVIPDKYLIDSTILWFSEICWVAAIGCTISLIRSCAKAVMYSRPSAEVVCQLIEKYNINCVYISAATANHLYKLEGIDTYDLSSARYVVFAGGGVSEQVDKNMLKIFPTADICFAYGMTEIGVVVRRENSSDKFCSCGTIRENGEIKVVDLENGRALGPNEEGEICFRSPYMILRYHKDPTSTKEVIDSEGWLHSGDMGYYDADGDFFVIDRLKEVIRYKIIMPVTPVVVERIILQHPDVIEVGVVAKPDFYDMEHPMAFITIRAGSKVTGEEIIEHVEQSLPDHMRLRGGVRILDKMPVTPTGKISKRHLRQMAKSMVKGD